MKWGFRVAVKSLPPTAPSGLSVTAFIRSIFRREASDHHFKTIFRRARTPTMEIATLLVCGFLASLSVFADTIRVRHSEGLIHGFLVLRTLDGTNIADGELTQHARGDRVTQHLVFRFQDGSTYDDTVIFSQGGTFRLLSEHLIQKGPAFNRAIDTSIDAVTGQVQVRYTDNGEEKVVNDHLKLPADIANGMVPILLKNVQPDSPRVTLSMVAVTPKPRLVKLNIAAEGEDSVLVGRSTLKSTRYVVKVELGGVAGIVAPIIGKQPPDTHIWILGGETPLFLKFEGPLYEGGPIWRIELVSPVWPKS
jgi:hypothetical protein